MHEMLKDMQSVLICAKHKLRSFSCACLCLLVTGLWSASGDWPIHRGDAALSGSLDVQYALPGKRSWSYKVGTRSVTSVVGTKGVAYVASGKGSVIALSVKTGQVLWRQEIEGEQFSAPPTLDAEYIYLGSDKGRLIALSQKDGSEKWRFKAKGKFVGSANLYKRKDGKTSLFVVSWDNHLYAINTADGSQLWTYATENRLNATPAVVKNNVIFGGCDGFVRVLDADDGTELAALDAGSYIAAPVAVDWPRVYVGHHEAKFLCMEPFAEKTHWTYQKREDPFVSAPATNGERIVFGSDDQRVHCVDKKGVAQWEYRTNGKVMSGALIAGQHVYVGSDDGFLYVLDLQTGKKLWSYEIGAEIDCDPAIIDHTLCISAHDGSVYAFALGAP